MEALDDERAWNNVFQVLRNTNSQPKLMKLTEVFVIFEGEINIPNGFQQSKPKENAGGIIFKLQNRKSIAKSVWKEI